MISNLRCSLMWMWVCVCLSICAGYGLPQNGTKRRLISRLATHWHLRMLA